MSGSCALCGHRVGNPKMGAHLGLRIQASEDPRYWSYLEMRADAAKLRHLDAFLRQLWLECCGHLSAFSIGERELPMSATAGAVLPTLGATFQYEYDFGDTTALEGNVWMTRQGSLGRAPVRLRARNDALAWTCAACGSPATVVCSYCREDRIFCEAHAAAHEHANEDVYLPVVNSPRMGVCGYTG